MQFFSKLITSYKTLNLADCMHTCYHTIDTVSLGKLVSDQQFNKNWFLSITCTDYHHLFFPLQLLDITILLLTKKMDCTISWFIWGNKCLSLKYNRMVLPRRWKLYITLYLYLTTSISKVKFISKVTNQLLVLQWSLSKNLGSCNVCI